jgi:hypothetical protein
MSMRDAPSSGGPSGLKASGLHPPCPKCQRLMTVKQVMPVLFAPNVDDVIYGCEDCGTELKRSVKR